MPTKPLIALVMGSTSDLPQVEPALEILRELQIPYSVRVLSAHRTPEEAAAFARNAKRVGLRTIIAIAGAAAHLGGVIAAHTSLPVVGVPIAATSLGGLDALLSTVQMPGGVPVATMGIGSPGVKNAVIFTARMLALENSELSGRLAAMTKKQAEKVLSRDREISASHAWPQPE